MDRRTAVGVLLASGLRGAPRAARNFSMTQGSPSAPVKVEVFSDFECPACAVLHFQTIKPLIADYVRPGKVYLINRQFPLQMHPYARQAALLATAAAGIGRYEIVADELFRKQSTWGANGKIDAVLAAVLRPPELKTVRELAATPEVAHVVDRDVALGVQYGIRQTPTLFVIRGSLRYPFSGAMDYSMLRQAVEVVIRK